MQTLIKTLMSGGCYWPKDEIGNSFFIPQGTLFEIALDGANGRRVTNGIIQNGYFEIVDGSHKGEKFISANSVVRSIREIPSKSNNAFLYIHFCINGNSVSADSMRYNRSFKCDEIEEQALNDAVKILKSRKLVDGLDVVGVRKKAAYLVNNNPQLLKSAEALVSLKREALLA